MESKGLVKAAKPQPKKNLWKPEEDLVLKTYIETHGEGNWATVSKNSGLKRGGKSCRLRWKNYLRPNIKRGEMSEQEEDLIIRMHKLLGNRWSLIAGRLPGRTDNEIKNYWNTHLSKRHNGSKRKSVDYSSNHHEHKKKIRSSNSEIGPSKSSTCIEETTLVVRNEEEEDRNNINSWMDGIHRSFNCDTDYPTLVPENYNATFLFDDEPFITYLDSFLLVEELGFGWSGEEANSLMQVESCPNHVTGDFY